MKKRKMSQAWKNRIWNGSILAAFVAAMAVFVFLLQTEKSQKKQRFFHVARHPWDNTYK